MRPGLSEDSGAPLQSPIHWAVLGLIIERPSYGYELGQRFERAFGGALHLSSASYIYKAIEVLEDRGLIEAIAGRGGGRQPKLRYRATPAGVDAYKDQLISEAGEDRRRSRLFARKLAVFVRDPEVALDLIAGYREACLREAVRPSQPSSVESELDPATRLAARLEEEETRVAIDAKLSWLDYATSELEALLAARAPRP
jgi:DNA-binding PadR family transcriptional regulator